MKLNARTVAAVVLGAVAGSYVILCLAARQPLHPNDAWHAARTMTRVALHRRDPACAEQLDHFGKALRSKTRSDGLVVDAQIHSFALPAMTTPVAASANGKHFVTVSRPNGLTVRDLEAMEKLGWTHDGSFSSMDVFERPGYALNVTSSTEGGQCLTSLYVTVARQGGR